MIKMKELMLQQQIMTHLNRISSWMRSWLRGPSKTGQPKRRLSTRAWLRSATKWCSIWKTLRMQLSKKSSKALQLRLKRRKIRLLPAKANQEKNISWLSSSGTSGMRSFGTWTRAIAITCRSPSSSSRPHSATTRTGATRSATSTSSWWQAVQKNKMVPNRSLPSPIFQFRASRACQTSPRSKSTCPTTTRKWRQLMEIGDLYKWKRAH